MTHIQYSRQYLESKTLDHVKLIAEKLGVAPEGDRRFKNNWINAIIEFQSSKIQKVEVEQVEVEPQAIIEYDEDSFAGLTQPFVVKVSGEEVFRASSYMSCERHCQWKGYNLVDQELEAEDERGSGRCDAIYNEEDLEQHLEGMCLYSDFCYDKFISDMEEPRKPVENRCYAVSDMVFLEKNGNAVCREYEIWYNGQFQYCILAHTGIKSGYISWMFFGENYPTIQELINAIESYRNKELIAA